MSIRKVFFPMEPSALPNPVMERTIVVAFIFLKVSLQREIRSGRKKNPSAEAEGNIWMG
jgi:hypothetical protein